MTWRGSWVSSLQEARGRQGRRLQVQAAQEGGRPGRPFTCPHAQPGREAAQPCPRTGRFGVGCESSESKVELSSRGGGLAGGRRRGEMGCAGG